MGKRTALIHEDDGDVVTNMKKLVNRMCAYAPKDRISMANAERELKKMVEGQEGKLHMY